MYQTFWLKNLILRNSILFCYNKWDTLYSKTYLIPFVFWIWSTNLPGVVTIISIRHLECCWSISWACSLSNGVFVERSITLKSFLSDGFMSRFSMRCEPASLSSCALKMLYTCSARSDTGSRTMARQHGVIRFLRLWMIGST